MYCVAVCAGAVYDWRRSYDDMFYVVGAVYAMSTIVFSAIPILQRYRNWRSVSVYDDMNGATCAEPAREAAQPAHTAGNATELASPDEREHIGLSKYARSYNATETR